jgi:hypothetical protein
VIALLNQCFVPVYISNEDYAADGPAPAADKAERDRVLREAHAAGLSVGTVHVYILSPDGGHPVDSLHVADAARAGRLLQAMEKAARRFGVAKGEPVVAPATQSAAPAVRPGALVLHLTARVLKPGGAWGEFPVESWVVYPAEEVGAFLAPGRPKAGDSWEVDRKAAEKLLTHFYPATENNDVGKNRFEELGLRGRVVSVGGGVARVRLDGRLTMKHTFYHKDDTNRVRATVVGFVDYDADARKVRSFRLVTDEASYGAGTFGVAVRSVP